MTSKNYYINLTKFLAILCLITASLMVATQVKAACQDTLLQCSCNNGNMVCIHQLNDCSTVSEIHNEMPTATSCNVTTASTSTYSPYPSPSASTTVVVGVGGGPISSSSPQVVATQSNNQTGELPRTGIPLGAVALLGLGPLGFKLRSFKSKFTGKDASTIWAEKQLRKD